MPRSPKECLGVTGVRCPSQSLMHTAMKFHMVVSFLVFLPGFCFEIAG